MPTIRIDAEVLVNHLKILLKLVHPHDDRLFSVVMLAFVKFGIVNEAELADELRQSLPTIKRWVRGRNLPGQNVRPQIHKWLGNKLEEISRQQ